MKDYTKLDYYYERKKAVEKIGKLIYEIDDIVSYFDVATLPYDNLEDLESWYKNEIEDLDSLIQNEEKTLGVNND